MGSSAAHAFVGRAAELALADELLRDVAAGRGRVLLVEGEAGIGKSRLLAELIDLASQRGMHVAAAECGESERARPFSAIGRALRLPVAEGVEAADSAAPAEQFRVLDAVMENLEAQAAAESVAVVLDDLHWADPGTLLSFASIARRVAPLPVLLVGAHRAAHGRADLHRVTDDAVRGGAGHISLGPLDDSAVATLAGTLLGHEPEPRLLDVLAGANGNPLVVTEFVRATYPSDDADRAVPLEFRSAVLRRIGQLPQESQDLLRLASVLGSQFAPGDLAAIVGSSLIALEPALHHAVEAGLLDERGDTLVFRHDLVRAALYEHIPLGVRRELHREVGHALAKANAAAPAVAHHLSLGTTEPDPDTAAWLRRAAAEAASRSPGTSAELLERCRDALPAAAPERVAVLTELVNAYAWSGRATEAEALATEVLARWPDTANRHALLGALVRALVWQGRSIEALRYVTVDADDTLDDSGARVLAAHGALAALWSMDLRQAEDLATRTAAAARRCGDDLALCQALSVQAWVANFGGKPNDAVTFARNAIDIADASPGGHAHLAHPCFFIGMPLVVLDRLDEAHRLLQEGRRHATERGLVWSQPLFHAHLGVASFVAGEWDAASAELEACLTIADEIGITTTVVASAAAWLAAIQLARDDIDAAEATISRALARQAETGPRAGPLLNWGRAMLHEARGEYAEALQLLQGAWDVFMMGGNSGDPWSSLALIRLCAATGDNARAVALLPVLEAHAAVADTPFMRGHALHCRGLATGDVDALLAAVEEHRRSPRPYERGAACESAAERLRTLGRVDEAVVLLDEAMANFERLGATRDVNRVRARLRTLGVARRGRQGQVSATTGWSSLTAAELRVVELVELRLSNPEIADRLFVSRHTVESHLKHIYRKLAIGSRRELANVAALHR
jgi:DNA-binding CsgD family transcriptional regulator/tetratricopeptide (TPR) repeat protein